jgi:hypothetical protein
MKCPTLRTTSCIALALLLYVPATLAEKKQNWEKAKVLSQSLNSSQAGVYAAPIGTAVVGVPIYRTSNRVVVETETHRLEWSEATSPSVILPVNGVIQFYRDKDWFIVLDSKKKKHKFGLVGMTVRTDAPVTQPPPVGPR